MKDHLAAERRPRTKKGEYGVEDLAEKDAVWDQLIRWFVRRLEAR